MARYRSKPAVTAPAKSCAPSGSSAPTADPHAAVQEASGAASTAVERTSQEVMQHALELLRAAGLEATEGGRSGMESLHACVCGMQSVNNHTKFLIISAV